ncbi:FtsX-like permease family protein [Rhodocytophaga rosea]|uniref:FtsX-like permease family protein n=1 Tax=Rhodocytophaga rosea TaxID=2704465 RepID=A0A6C0GS52_9BACT|nr:ABC transporter permease [Rhodocytophaga rosea]QHT70433.1 FtsX-like permease family protein [Rhodocytophaga rosea]
MLRNYFTIAYRNLLRQKSYTLINISGLALGVASCLILFLIVRNELGYDNFHSKADRIYRVTLNALDFNSNISLAVAPALRNDFGQLEQVTQVYYERDGLVQIGEKRFNEKGFTFADDHFFKVFDYQWIAGDPATALSEPNAVVLTESLANKYFGNREVIGKVIRLNNQYDLKVTGLIKDVPSNTHLPFSFAASWKTIEPEYKRGMTNFWNIPGGSYTYIVLPENYSIRQLESSIPSFLKKNWGEDIAKEAKMPFQRLRDIHFDQRYINNIITPTGKETFWALAGVAVFIIITACINFINLATAQAIKRSKEVGVRKVLGAHRSQLMRQFLGETALLVIVSVLIAVLATHLLLPIAGQYMDITISTDQLSEPGVVGIILALTLGMIVLAGLYPAVVQSGFTPALALKSKLITPSSRGLTLRKSLVIVQFCISQILIIGTVVVASQMDFFRNQNLGFNKEEVLSFRFPSNDKNKVAMMRAELAKMPAIADISFSSGAPAYNNNFTSFSSKELGMLKNDVTELKFIDEHYMDMFGFTLLAGRPITEANKKDTIFNVVVNETLIHKLGINNPEEAIGKHITGDGDVSIPIMGVIKDFQSESRHKKIRACVMAYLPDAFNQVSVRIQPGQMRQTIAAIDQLWSATFPDQLFEYEFLDERIANMYKQEEKVYTAFQLFSAIAIFIGCLGLYGLISFVAVQKTKEVGIRKVLGASVWNIVYLFSKEFTWLILISFLIAAPVAWYAMHSWLENFAYSIAMSWNVFVIALAAAFIIAAITVSYKSIKAALANPVKSLRTE